MTSKPVDHALRELIDEASTRGDFVGPRPPEVVRAAEERLGVGMPPSYRTFLLELGTGDVDGEEVYGIIDESTFDRGVPDVVAMTEWARAAWGLPADALVVGFDGAISYYVLDSGADTGAVVAWTPGVSSTIDGCEQVAVDFVAFLGWVLTRSS